MSKKPIDTSKFEKITRRITTPNMEMICGTLKKEEHISQLAQAILDISDERQALVVAQLIYDLQRQLKECRDRNKS